MMVERHFGCDYDSQRVKVSAFSLYDFRYIFTDAFHGVAFGEKLRKTGLWALDIQDNSLLDCTT